MSASMQNALSVHHVSKSYGTITALKDVSFDVLKGAIFGILGPNGSGKTTLLGILTDVLKADAGDFTLLGETPSAETRKQTGTLLETSNFYHYLSARKNLEITANIKGKDPEQIDEVLKKVDLYERRNSKFSTFSLGMKQRLAIAGALLGSPQLLILDEPTNGLDPNGIADIRKLIRQLAQEGITVLMASHLLDEVEKICTHVAILKYGKLLATGDVRQVLKDESAIELAANDMHKLQAAILKIAASDNIEIADGKIILHLQDDRLSPERLNQYCFENGVTLTHLHIRKKSLEAKFLEITH